MAENNGKKMVKSKETEMTVENGTEDIKNSQTDNNSVGSTLPAANALKDRFKAGSIPLQSDFADLIDMANTALKAIGASADQSTPGVGFKLDSNGVLQLKLDPGYSKTDYSPVKFVDDILTVDLGSGLVNKSNGICVGAGNGIVVNDADISIDPKKVLPTGIISMFYGKAVPEGWAICDGTNGTPDLRERFILGGDVKDVGGVTETRFSGDKNSKSFSFTSDAATIKYSGLTNKTFLDAKHIPNHQHLSGIKVGRDDYSEFGVGQPDRNKSDTALFLSGDHCEPLLYRTSGIEGDDRDMGVSDGHDHSIQINGGSHTHNAQLTVPYYILAFIMKL